jgi:hypothetical protein
MRSSLFMIFLLSIQLVFAQGWKVSSGESDFDGTYKVASCVGVGGSIPYTSARLYINHFNEEDINFYLTDFGYAGCDENSVTFLFDKKRLYNASFNVNEENDAFFFNMFWKDGIDLIFMDQIFKELTISSRLAIRVSNDCFIRDYIFDLNGSRQAIDKVVGLKNIDLRIKLIEDVIKAEHLMDSMYNYLNVQEVKDVEPSEFFEIHRYLKNKSNDKFYFTDARSFRVLSEIIDGYSANGQIKYVDLNSGKLIGHYASDLQKLEIDVSVNQTGDSIRFDFSDSQLYIDSLLRANIGREVVDYYRFVRRINFEVPSQFFDRLSHNVLLEMYYRSLYHLSKFIYVFEPIDVNDAVFRIFNQSGEVVKEWKYPYFLEDEKERKARVAYEQDKARKAEEARRQLLDTPDLSHPPYNWSDIEVKPKPSSCVNRPEEVCLRDFITTRLDVLFVGSQRKKFTNIYVNVIVDHTGKLTISGCDKLKLRSIEVLQSVFNDLPPLDFPRKNGKVCSVKVELYLP